MQYLIDASVYVFRAYYSMPDDMVDDQGNPVNALYGFCRFLGDFMEQVRPEYVAVLFDESRATNFRTEIYPQYKANRDPAPPELKRQFGQCREFTRALGLMNCSHPNYEADDLIGTLVSVGRREGRRLLLRIDGLLGFRGWRRGREFRRDLRQDHALNRCAA